MQDGDSVWHRDTRNSQCPTSVIPVVETERINCVTLYHKIKSEREQANLEVINNHRTNSSASHLYRNEI